MNSATKQIVGIVTFILVALGLYSVYQTVRNGKGKGASALNDAINALGGESRKGRAEGGPGDEQAEQVAFEGDSGKQIRILQENVNLVLATQDRPAIQVTGVYDADTISAVSFLYGRDNISVQDALDLSVSAREALAQQGDLAQGTVLTRGAY